MRGEKVNYLLKEENNKLTIIGSCEDNCDYITALGRKVKEGEELWFVKAGNEQVAIDFCYECGTFITSEG